MGLCIQCTTAAYVTENGLRAIKKGVKTLKKHDNTETWVENYSPMSTTMIFTSKLTL